MVCLSSHVFVLETRLIWILTLIPTSALERGQIRTYCTYCGTSPTQGQTMTGPIDFKSPVSKCLKTHEEQRPKVSQTTDETKINTQARGMY